LAPRRGTAAAQTLERPGPPAIADPARWRTRACFRQEAGEGASRGCLAHRGLAGGLERNLILALRRRANKASLARPETFDAPSARMAPHRMARGRERTHEIL